MSGRKTPLAALVLFSVLIATSLGITGCITNPETHVCGNTSFNPQGQSCCNGMVKDGISGCGSFSPVTLTHLEDAISKTCNGCPDNCTMADGRKICSGSCSSPSCSGGSGTANYSAILHQSSPSRDGSSTLLSITAGSRPTDFLDDLFWIKVGAQKNATHFVYDLWVYPDNDSLNAKALEFDLIQVVSGVRYDFSSQCVYHCNNLTCYWQVWDPTTSPSWVDSSLVCEKFAPNAWHHIVWEYQIHPDTRQTEYLTLTLDNVSNPMYLKNPSEATPWADNLLIQIQQDTRPLGENSFSEWVDEVNLTFW